MPIHPFSPSNLPPRCRNIDPEVLRHLIYRIIGGSYGKEIDYISSWELEVLADLKPQVWNDPRDPTGHRVIGQYTTIFTIGFCLNCKQALRYPDGTDHPLQQYCCHCTSRTGKAPDRRSIVFVSTARGALVNGFSEWEPKYQYECIAFLTKLYSNTNTKGK